MWIDTDIGDDIDDAFGVGLALASPELHILGISTAWAYPGVKARLVDRLLCETGRTEISVSAGLDRRSPGQGPLSQAAWAAQQPNRDYAEAVPAMLAQIRQYPGAVTLVALGPLTNVAAALDQDPVAFHALKRIVLMGGSIRQGYQLPGGGANHTPDPEYNIATDVEAARKVFAAGVPLYVMPLDATQVPLNVTRRDRLFASGTRLTDAIAQLYAQWSPVKGMTDPVLFDPVAMAFVLRPSLCPVTPMRIEVDAKGLTRVRAGTPNSFVCLQSDRDAFYRFYMSRLLEQRLQGRCGMQAHH